MKPGRGELARFLRRRKEAWCPPGAQVSGLKEEHAKLSFAGRRNLWGSCPDSGAPSRLGEPFADGESRKVHSIVDVQLGHQARRVVVHRLHTQMHGFRDLFLRESACDVTEHLEFP